MSFNDPNLTQTVSVSGTPTVSVTGALNASSLAAGSSAVANGTAIDNGTPKSNHNLVVITTGTPTAGTVILQGSLDGTNWYTLGTQSPTGAGVSITNVANTPTRYVRAAITTAFSGGTIQAGVASST